MPATGRGHGPLLHGHSHSKAEFRGNPDTGAGFS